MKTELDYCLLTYTCDCAATIASTEDHDEEQSSEREPFEFGRCRIVERQNFDRDCDDPLCKCKDSAESRKKEVHRLIRQIQSRCRENSTAYIKLGQRYHSCLLRARMRLSNSKLCAPAHEQFAISTTPRRDDPFFKLDGKVQSLLFGPRIAIQDVEDVHILKLAMRVVNKALFLSCLKAEMMLSRVGVNAIVAAERKEFGPVTPRGEVKSKGLPQKDSASGKEQKHTLPLPRKLSLPDDEAFSGKSINHPLSSCRSSPQKSSGSAATATHTEAARLNTMTSTSKEAVVVTLACPHFAVFPAGSYRAFTEALARDDFIKWQDLLHTHSESRRSLDGLWKYSPTVLIPTEYHCGRNECILYPGRWPRELGKILVGLNEFWEHRKSLYLQMGEEYFDMVLLLPASAIDGQTSLMAHKQFVVETRQWTQDPFFESWREAATAIEAAMLTAGRDSLANTQDALRCLIRGMPNFLRMTNDIWELKELVAEHSEQLRAQSVTAQQRSRHGRFPVQSDLAVRKEAFAHAARKTCEKRMEGFEDFGVKAMSVPDRESKEQPEEEELPIGYPRPSVDVNVAENVIDAMDWY
ncbi:hypothetical protein M409DRAFT_61543 [Zasmidium cellare ATCC 36951]|uniref:Uncharacterized protein n=1 Tax=Zasmidium cellare ATCC 36951 TaxID=1080233 RepID=A0A6A6BUU7_ZASCE|nr:uncharacterized protein M409DRAFT_61543 [Zasmidium cellare ATCC 36951]KAF2158567.1 hypothetical protein M409DRAFT_61543 [Zasmidium cellare ATCC 36951]